MPHMELTTSASMASVDSTEATNCERPSGQSVVTGALRILAVCNTRFGSNDNSYVSAFRRAGHSVIEASSETYLPRWRSKSLRAVRRLLARKLVAEFSSAIIHQILEFQPHLFFVFKGESVHPDVVRVANAQGAVTVNFWPDVSFRAHGPLPPQTLPLYDWVFNSKSYGLGDLATQLGQTRASFLPHAYDPEVHRPVLVDSERDHDVISDASFIGNWSPKKEGILRRIVEDAPECSLRIWGPEYWRKARGLETVFQGRPVVGHEYARAICGSKINICILSERRVGSSSGDLTTARTFELAGTGGFMLHERTDEAMRYFEEDKECAFFDGVDDLVAKIRYYLAHEEERKTIAVAGRQRALSSGYSYDDRVATVIAKYHELRVAQASGKADA